MQLALTKKRNRLGSRWQTLLTLAIATVMAFPLFYVLLAFFAPVTDGWVHLQNTLLGTYIFNTVVLAVGVGLGTTIIGTGCAWLVTMCEFPGRRIFQWALFLPLAVPAYVLAYTYTDLLQYAGPVQSGLREAMAWGRGDYYFPEIRSLGGAVFVLTFALYPYVYMLARATFNEQSMCIIEVSRSLGCSAMRVFTRVALPLARPAIIGGVALVLMETLGDFGAVSYFSVKTFTTGIFHAWRDLGDIQAALKLASILAILVIMALYLERLSRKSAKFHHTSARYRPLPNYELHGWRRWAVIAICAAPVIIGFVLPGAQLAWWAMTQTSDLHGFTGLVIDSVTVALIASVIAVGVATLLAYGLRLNNSPLVAAATRLSVLGYAVPGLILAIGIVVPFTWLENSIDAWFRANWDISTGLFLSGSLVALLFAYVVRFLAVSFNTIEASLGKVTPSYDAAARTLGAGVFGTLRRVHVPLVSGSLLTAGLLVFVDVLKELPATYVLRPFNFNTLAVRTFELASDEQLAAASVPALAIVLVGLIPIILMSRAISTSRPGQQAVPEGAPA
jgi:iron(III) transport system permease protein